MIALHEIRILRAIRYSIVNVSAIVEFRENLHSVSEKVNTMVEWPRKHFVVAPTFGSTIAYINLKT